VCCAAHFPRYSKGIVIGTERGVYCGYETTINRQNVPPINRHTRHLSPVLVRQDQDRDDGSLNKEVKIPHTIWLIAPNTVYGGSYAFSFLLQYFGQARMVAGAEQAMTGLQVGALITFYVAVFTAPLLMAIWLWQYSRGVELVTNEKMGFATALLILLVVPDGIDILIVQESFNKIALPAPTGPVAPASN
jgi:hypothetical protein